MFSDPTQGERCSPSEVIGHLLIIKPTEHRTGVPTANYGPKDAIQVDVVDLDQGGKIFRDCLWFNGVLIGSLRGHLGELVLGRMAQGQPKPGQSAPYILETVPDGPAKQGAQQWVNANPGFMSGFADPNTTPAAVNIPQPTPAPQMGGQQQLTPETAALLAQLQANQRV